MLVSFPPANPQLTQSSPVRSHPQPRDGRPYRLPPLLRRRRRRPRRTPPQGHSAAVPRQGAHRATKNVQQPRGDERAAGELPGWAPCLVEFDQLPVEYVCLSTVLVFRVLIEVDVDVREDCGVD